MEPICRGAGHATSVVPDRRGTSTGNPTILRRAERASTSCSVLRDGQSGAASDSQRDPAFLDGCWRSLVPSCMCKASRARSIASSRSVTSDGLPGGQPGAIRGRAFRPQFRDVVGVASRSRSAFRRGSPTVIDKRGRTFQFPLTALSAANAPVPPSNETRSCTARDADLAHVGRGQSAWHVRGVLGRAIGFVADRDEVPVTHRMTSAATSCRARWRVRERPR